MRLVIRSGCPTQELDQVVHDRDVDQPAPTISKIVVFECLDQP
jgi:hypothetical protein